MTQKLTFKQRFKAQKQEPDKRKIISLHISEGLDDVVAKAAQKHKVTKQDLIRQMIRHCLQDIGFNIPQDTDSRPPTKRVYKKSVQKKRR